MELVPDNGTTNSNSKSFILKVWFKENNNWVTPSLHFSQDLKQLGVLSLRFEYLSEIFMKVISLLQHTDFFKLKLFLRSLSHKNKKIDYIL